MCVCKPVSLSPSPPPLSWHLWTACSSPPAHRALLIFAQPRIGQELTLNTGSHMDALHLNQGAGIQPLQMQDSTVRLIRPSACGKRALDVLHRRGGGAVLSGMLLGLGGPGRERRSTDCAWPTAPQILAPCIPRSWTLRPRSWPTAPQILAPCISRSWTLRPRSWPPASPEPQQPCNPRPSSPAPPAAQGNPRSSLPGTRAPGPAPREPACELCDWQSPVGLASHKTLDLWIQACGAHLRAPQGWVPSQVSATHSAEEPGRHPAASGSPWWTGTHMAIGANFLLQRSSSHNLVNTLIIAARL